MYPASTSIWRGARDAAVVASAKHPDAHANNSRPARARRGAGSPWLPCSTRTRTAQTTTAQTTREGGVVHLTWGRVDVDEVPTAVANIREPRRGPAARAARTSALELENPGPLRTISRCGSRRRQAAPWAAGLIVEPPLPRCGFERRCAMTTIVLPASYSPRLERAPRRVSILSWLFQTFCGLRGHDLLLHFEPCRLRLACATCGYETPGWAVAAGNRCSSVASPQRDRRDDPAARRARQ